MPTVPTAFVRLMSLVMAALTITSCSRPAPAPEVVRAVRTMTIQSQAVQGQVEFAAEVRARTESRLGFRVPGKLLDRPIDAGQRVRVGQRLAMLDPQDLKLAQTAAQAAVEAGRIVASQARDDFDRFRALHAQGFISAAELQRRESSLRAAEAQLAQASAQADVQANQAGYSQLTAPAAGIVTAVEAEPGAVLSAGQPVLRLAHDGPRDVVFSVPEDRVADLRSIVGRAGALTIRLWGEAQPLPARLREVAAAADPLTRTFLVKAELGEARVELGRTATATLPLVPRGKLLRLPLSAVFEQQGRAMVWVLDAATMKVRAQPVQVGGAVDQEVWLSDGLAPGAEVVTAGVHVLTEGQQVTRYARPTAADAAVSR